MKLLKNEVGENMRKLAVLALVSMFLLSGCDGGYDLTKRTILTDVTIKEIDSYMVGKVTKYSMSFKKGKGKEQELDIDNSQASSMKKEIESLYKTSEILDSKEELLFDLILDGDEIIEISLSKNRQ